MSRITGTTPCFRPSWDTRKMPSRLTINNSVEFIIGVDNTSKTDFRISGLPPGLRSSGVQSLSSMSHQVTISGSPTTAGTYEVKLSARNPTCSSSHAPQDTVTLKSVYVAVTATACGPAPTLSLPSLIFTLGQATNLSFTVNNATTAALGGLPTGVTATGNRVGSNYEFKLSGTPTTGSQNYNITLTASNAGTNCATVSYNNTTTPSSISSGTVDLIPCSTPVISQLSNNIFQQGLAYRETVIIQNATRVIFSGVPTGINIVSGISGTNLVLTVSGTPTVAAQSYSISVTAYNKSSSSCSESTSTAVIASGVTLAAGAPAPTVDSITSNTLSKQSGNSIFQRGIQYNGTILVKNATSANIVAGTLPNGLNWTGAKSGNNFVITVTGTPTTSNQSFNIKVNATNDPVTTPKLVAATKNDISASSGTVLGSQCAVPSIGLASLTSSTLASMRAGVRFNGVVSVANATSLQLSPSSILPSDITTTISTTKVGPINYASITFSGIPARRGQPYDISVIASDKSGSCVSVDTTISLGRGTVG